jgi:hypothetical protein
MPDPKRPLKVFLCHIIPLWDAHVDTLRALRRNPVRGLYTRLTTPALAGGAREDGVDAWLDKEKLLPGQGFDRLNLPDWELEIRQAV